MSKSSKAAKDQPGKQVAQKFGLNRAILDGSPFELLRQLESKTQWSGGRLSPVPPQNTSRPCPVSLGGCGQVSADSRKRQAKFVCVKCGLSANADFISAVNIREAGLASPARFPPFHAVKAAGQGPPPRISPLAGDTREAPGASARG